MVLDIAIIIFLVLELSNVIIMYFKPDFKYGNSMRAFKEWDRSKEDEKRHLYGKYMVRWVANCKLIFIVLLIVVLCIGSEMVKVYAVGATILSIGIYFITLHPIIAKLDKLGEIYPKGYSKILAGMIASFMIMFSVALLVHFLIK